MYGWLNFVSVKSSRAHTSIYCRTANISLLKLLPNYKAKACVRVSMCVYVKSSGLTLILFRVIEINKCSSVKSFFFFFSGLFFLFSVILCKTKTWAKTKRKIFYTPLNANTHIYKRKKITTHTALKKGWVFNRKVLQYKKFRYGARIHCKQKSHRYSQWSFVPSIDFNPFLLRIDWIQLSALFTQYSIY